MRIELHCHSTCSDGALQPSAVGALARDRGVELFALTDHDTTAGTAAAGAAFSAQAVRAVELSCYVDRRSVHILLFETPDSEWEVVEATLLRLRQARVERARRIVDKLTELGVPVNIEDTLKGDKPIGRPDLAQALVDAGWVPTLREAYNQFLRDGGPADLPVSLLSVSDGLEMARAARVKASLAHPHVQPGPVELLKRHRTEGLDGLEVFYGSFSPGERQHWLEVAERFDLVATGGSDNHGHQGDPEHGVDIPAAQAERLLQWLGR